MIIPDPWTIGLFGIGTFLTNDFRTESSGKMENSKALNMVIKLNSINDQPTVKISDDIEKVILAPFILATCS
jgi:nicotinic acid phosphoribosyltransferase